MLNPKEEGPKDSTKLDELYQLIGLFTELNRSIETSYLNTGMAPIFYLYLMDALCSKLCRSLGACDMELLRKVQRVTMAQFFTTLTTYVKDHPELQQFIDEYSKAPNTFNEFMMMHPHHDCAPDVNLVQKTTEDPNGIDALLDLYLASKKLKKEETKTKEAKGKKKNGRHKRSK